MSLLSKHITALFRMLPDPVWLKDPDGVYLAGNARFEELLGVREADFIGKTDYDFVTRAEADFFRSHDLAAITAKAPCRNEEWLTFVATGYRGLFETVKTPLYDEEGLLIGIIGVARDITPLKQAEEALLEERRLLARRIEARTAELTRANSLLVQESTERERTLSILRESEERLKQSEALLRSITEGTTDAIFVTDRFGRLVFANSVTQALAGHDIDEILGKTAAEFFPDPVIGRAMALYNQRLMESDRTEMIEETLSISAGVRSFLTTKAPRRDSDGTVIGLIGIARDITDRKCAEEALAEQKQHDRLNMELVLAGVRERRRVSSVLHDQIGQNLLLQKIKLRMLEDSIDTPPELRMLSEIRELLDESITGVRSLTVQLCPPILATLGLTAAVEWLGKKFKSDYNLDVDVTDDGAPKPLDQEQREVLYQAIRELLINITKHAGTDRAELTLNRERARLIVVVADQGRGYAPAVKSGIASGDSYGLHFIRRNMEHFGGAMMVASKPGHGTRVTLHFPLLTT